MCTSVRVHEAQTCVSYFMFGVDIQKNGTPLGNNQRL